MRKLLLLSLLVVSCTIITNAQVPYWIWATHSGGGSYEYPNGLWVDKYDSLYLAGRLAGTISFNGGASGSGTGADNPFIAKLDSTGTSKWIESISFSGGYDYGWGFCIDSKSNVYTGGVVSSGASMFIMKYNTHGKLLWQITPSGGGVAAMGLITDGADNLYVTGSLQGNVTFGSTTLSYTGSGQNAFLAKLDSNGNFLWAVSSGIANGNSGYDVARSITVDEFANVYIGGGYGGQITFGSFVAPEASSGSNLFIAEFDSSGHPLNLITAVNGGIDNGDCCTLNHITLDSCRNIYMTGYFENTVQFGKFSLPSQGGQDIYVAKADNSGNWQWADDIGGSGNDNPGGITFDKNSDVYVGGEFQNGSAMFGDTVITGGHFFVAKFSNGTGAIQYVMTAGTDPNGGNVGGVTVDNQKYIYVTLNAGTTPVSFGPNITITPSSNSDIFLAKIDTIPPRYIIPNPLSSYCPGSTTDLTFSLVGNFRQGNIFTAQLSDSAGNFADGINIGTDTSILGGTIEITIPDTVKQGNTYLIRVISSNPATSSYVNGCHAYYQKNVYTDTSYITIGGSSSLSISASADTICSGGSVTLIAKGGSSYMWSTGATTDTIIVKPTTDTTYSLTSSGACSGSDSIKLTVNTVLPLSIYPPGASICSGQRITLIADTTGNSYTWIPATGLSATTGDSVVANPTADITYTITGIDSLGCQVTGNESVFVGTGPLQPTITLSGTGDTLFSNANNGIQWYVNGIAIHGATDSIYVIQGLPSNDTVTVEVTNAANGCSTTSNPFITTGINQLLINNQLSIYPNPTNGAININISTSVKEVKDWNLQVTDVLGRTLYTLSTLNYNNQINLSNLSSGVYFITIINKTNRAVYPVIKEN